MSPTPKISLDGKTLEGGGQLLRLAISLSSLTSLPLHIHDIRANRAAAPRKASQQPAGGGLKPAHLAAVEWLAKATQAETKGMVRGSRELDFQPLSMRMRRGRSGAAAGVGGVEEGEGAPAGKATGEMVQGNNVWQDIFEDDNLVRRETRIRLSSPGSVCLILQAILPYLIFHSPDLASSSSSMTEGREEDGTVSVPVRITIEGGTNVSKSPSIDYVDQVLIPLLVEKVGIPPLTTKIIKRGWSSGRADIGAVQFDMTPFGRGSKLAKFDFSNRGQVSKVRVSILAPSQSTRDSLRGKVTKKLLAHHPDAEILFPVEEDTKNGARWYLLLVAETSNGYRIGRDCLWDRKSNAGTAEIIVNAVVKDLERELAHGGCVDEYMQDQLVVFQALAEGRSTVDSGENAQATLHTQTARWVAEQVLGLKFDERGTCSGCGFEVGEVFFDRKTQEAVAETTADLQELKI